MTRTFEDRATYDPATEAVSVVTFTVECHPKQAQAVIDFLVEVRDCAGVYAVDFDSGVRIPEAQPVLEILTLAALADTVDFHVDETEGEVHAEPEIQPAGGASDAIEVGDGETAAGEPATDVDAGKDGGVAGVAGEVGAGAIGGSEESERLPEV